MSLRMLHLKTCLLPSQQAIYELWKEEVSSYPHVNEQLYSQEEVLNLSDLTIFMYTYFKIMNVVSFKMYIIAFKSLG